jgi:hypothetical protein
MTDSAIAAKTRIFAWLEQALNAASLEELVRYLDLLKGGGLLGDLLKAQWDSGHPLFKLSRADQGHLLNHVFNRNGQGWWGSDVEAIATESLAQALTRMLFDGEGGPRRWVKRIDCWWMLAGTHHFHGMITESMQQITMLWMTPPKGDQKLQYEQYKQQLELACRTLKRPVDPGFLVPDNYTRSENIWIVSAERWALTHGVDAKGKPRRCADDVRLQSKVRGVKVTRQLCEDFKNRYPQLGRSGAGKRSSKRT